MIFIMQLFIQLIIFSILIDGLLAGMSFVSYTSLPFLYFPEL